MTEDEEEKYKMSISLNVVNHLGLNLYSNVPAVIAEAVANSWDADAEDVRINIDPTEEKISIEDDGTGMNRYDINNRYLNVGYRRRDDQDMGGDETPIKGRPVMGRKGIGKLSLFSVAKTIKVFSKKEGSEPQALEMNIGDIREQISAEEPNEPHSEGSTSANGSYEPIDLIKENGEGFFYENFPEDCNRGTLIKLDDLKKQVHRTATHLRKRLARRFSILGGDFSVWVNGNRVDITERDYFHKIEYLWTIGDTQKEYSELCNDLVGEEHFEGRTPEGNTVRGWIGSSNKPKDLQVRIGGGAQETDDLNKVPLMVRGKMAKRDILQEIETSRVFIDYLCGEIHADFLDDSDEKDITTSDRDDFDQDDERYKDLLSFLKVLIKKKIDSSWENYRSKEGLDEARKNEAIDEWLDTLSEDERRSAGKLFGKVNKLRLSEDNRSQVFKYSVMAFQKLKYKNALNRIDDLNASDLQSLNDAFVDLDDLEAALYHQVINGRIKVIEKLKQAVDSNALEDVLQEHLFEHLWLLDPAWERATDTEYSEQRIYNTFQEKKEEITEGLTDEERRGRIDLKYRKTAGQHVIVELKRAERRVNQFELFNQVQKYKRALDKILENVGRGHESVEVVCVIGKDLTDWENSEGKLQTEKAGDVYDVRIIKYDELIDNAFKAYSKYLEKQEELDKTQEIIDSIEGLE